MQIKDIFNKILEISNKNKFPDIHLNTNKKAIMRHHNWDLETLETLDFDGQIIDFPILTKEDISEIIKIIAWNEGLLKFEENFELDTSYKYEEKARYRVNCYMDTAWYNIAMRIIPTEIPSLEDLWLGDTIKEMCNKNKWLILVTWPTWSWKSTNLAAMIDYINSNFKKHIITVEDPVEFSFNSKKSLINQRELWNHTKWFPEAIRRALREDPDVIMLWEMRDPETIKAAITLAETGHLVLSTLHTNDTVQSVDRIIDVFPSGQQEQIRMQLALSLVWIVSQRLVPRIDKDGRIAAREILINNDAVRNLVITGKTHQLYSVIEVWWKQWMVLMDKYLSILYKKWIINKETMESFARDKEWINML